MTFTLEPVDDGFLTSAPSRYSETFSIVRPAEEIWRRPTSEYPLDRRRILLSAGPRSCPSALGDDRQVRFRPRHEAAGLFVIREEGHCYAFYATAANLPVFRRLAEDYIVELTAQPPPLHLDLRRGGDPPRSWRARERAHFKQLSAETCRRLAVA